MVQRALSDISLETTEMLQLSRAPHDHEDLFLQRYASLVAWASRLCADEVEQAEDLVHDAFVAFTLARPDLSGIDNIDGYLRGMLRKLHVSATRRAARRGHVSLSLLDYESAVLGLRAIGAARVEAQDELACVCRYACARKASSKSGSILILRFFHGYFPSEIARVARCSVRAVDEWLRFARREARLYRDAPHRLRFHGQDRDAPTLTTLADAGSAAPAQLLQAMLTAIFEARPGACLGRRELKTLYAATSDASIDAPRLAHIVSCPSCLDRINALLGLPSLSDRSPHDMLGPHRGGPGAGGSSGSRATSVASRRREHRWRTSYEHRAQQLQVVVNGFLVGSNTVGGLVTAQHVAVTFDEPVGSVEVFGDRGVPLAYLDVEPPPAGRVEQSVFVSLSDDRRLRVGISFARPWPEVDVEYEDPHWRDADTALDVAEPLRPGLPPSQAARNGWRQRLWAPLEGRWRLALAAGCLGLIVLLAPDTTLRAAERVAHTATAFARELVSMAQRLWRGDAAPPSVSTPIATPVLPSEPVPAAPPTAAGRSSSPPPSAAALARAEIETMARLDGIGRLLGGQIDVQRRSGYVRVHGLVEDEAGKDAVLRALRPLTGTRLVRAEVSTVGERLRREAPPAGRAMASPPRVVEGGRIPLGDRLRASILERPEWTAADPSAVELEVQRVATAALNASLGARLHGAVLRSLAERYDGGALQTLSVEAYHAWRALLSAHADALRVELHRVRAIVAPLLAGASPVERESPSPPLSPNAAALQIAAFTVTFDDTMRAWVSASGVPPDGPSRLEDPAFWDGVRQAELLAEDLKR